MTEPPFTIAIAATFTAEPVEESLRFWLDEIGLAGAVEFAPYNQVLQQLLDPGSLLGRNSRGVNILLVRTEDWSRFSAQPVEAEREFVEAVESFTARSSVPLLVCGCPGARSETLESLEKATGLQTFGSDEILATYPVEKWADASADSAGHVPFTAEFYAALGTFLARRIRALVAAPFKIVAVDADNTLWSGICGEEGPRGVEPLLEVQEFLAAQNDAGMLLALCSKNAPEDVHAVFDARPEMPLRRDRFAAVEIGWNAKSEGLRRLSEKLGLGLDSFIFLDDNPVECSEVRAACPEVAVLQLPADPSRIRPFLENAWPFDRVAITDADRLRADSYRQEVGRKKLRENAATFDDFLAGLQLEVGIERLREGRYARAAQLTQRTNQFNASTIRRSAPEIARHAADCLTVSVRDRFGDYGLVGLIVLERRPDALRAETFLLSCRVLGRGVEYRMLAHLGALAKQRNLPFVEIAYAPTPKNEPVRHFLETVGQRISADEAVATKPRATAVASATTSPAAAPVRQSADFDRIASELTSASSILAAIRARKRPRPSMAQSPVAPRSDMERMLLAIWSDVLRIEGIGVEDRFADLGGESLQVVQVHSQICESLGRPVEITTLFERPTIRSLAVALDPAPPPRRSAVADRAARQRQALSGIPPRTK